MGHRRFARNDQALTQTISVSKELLRAIRLLEASPGEAAEDILRRVLEINPRELVPLANENDG